MLKRNINSDGDWLVGSTELASEQETTAFSTLDFGSLGGSEVTRVFVVLVELAGDSPAKLLRTAVHKGFSHSRHLPEGDAGRSSPRPGCPSQSSAQPVPAVGVSAWGS